LKILLLQDAEWRKKGPHQQHHLMELLSLRGHQIKVIGFDQLWREENGSFISKRIVDKDISRFYKGSKVTFIRPLFLKIPLIDCISYLFSSQIEVKRQISDFKPDVIIGFSSIISNLWGAIYANNEKIPYIYYWYDIVHTLNVPKLYKPIAILLEKIIINKSSSVIVINEALKDYIINFGANPSITKVIPGGIDQERFNPERLDFDLLRCEFGFSDRDIVLFFMGWIYEFSGLDRVITELFKSGESASKIKLLIVGEGDYYPRLKALVKGYGLEDRVKLTGKRPYEDIPKLIATSDICLLPAIDNEVMRYIVPIKMYEYLAMHKLVISTKLMGIMKEFGQHNGVIYVDRPEDIIYCVLQLDNEHVNLYQEHAKDFIKFYDWNLIVIRFENILKYLVKEK